MTTLTDSSRRWLRLCGILFAAGRHVTRKPRQAEAVLGLVREMLRREAGPIELPGTFYAWLRAAEVARQPASDVAAGLATMFLWCDAAAARQILEDRKECPRG